MLYELFNPIPILRAQFILNGVGLDLGSQLICIVGLEFPTMGGPLPSNPLTPSGLD